MNTTNTAISVSPALTTGSWYWVTVKGARTVYLDGGSSRSEITVTKQRQCLAVREDGCGLFNYLWERSDGMGWYEKDAPEWVSASQCVLCEPPPKKGFWASLLS